MKSSFARLSLTVAISLVASQVWAVGAQPEPDLSFANEQDFLAKFGAAATRVDEGSYSLQRGDHRFEVHFGKASLEVQQRVVQGQLAALMAKQANTLTAEDSGDLVRLQLRDEQLSRELASWSEASAKNNQDPGPKDLDLCGFQVTIRPWATPSMTGGSAWAIAQVSPSRHTVSREKNWKAEITLDATAAYPDFLGGIAGRHDDHVSHITFKPVDPPRRARVDANHVWYVCLRAVATARVIRESSNPWFPYYCGNPISVVAHWNSPNPHGWNIPGQNLCPTHF